MARIRLFVHCDNIIPDKLIEITNNDFHYLVNVMRRRIDDDILIFNGRDGQWSARVTSINKKKLLY